jgi:hypothetical protein
VATSARNRPHGRADRLLDDHDAFDESFGLDDDVAPRLRPGEERIG